MTLLDIFIGLFALSAAGMLTGDIIFKKAKSIPEKLIACVLGIACFVGGTYVMMG